MSVRLLLVDDNRTFLAAVKHFLDTLPAVQVLGEANDGPTALGLAAQLQPDLVLLDVVMPGMNGLEVAAALQRMPHPPRIVFLSMHDNDSYRRATRDLGVDAYVSKSEFVTDLVPLIESVERAQSAGLAGGAP